MWNKELSPGTHRTSASENLQPSLNFGGYILAHNAKWFLQNRLYGFHQKLKILHNIQQKLRSNRFTETGLCDSLNQKKKKVKFTFSPLEPGRALSLVLVNRPRWRDHASRGLGSAHCLGPLPPRAHPGSLPGDQTHVARSPPSPWLTRGQAPGAETLNDRPLTADTRGSLAQTATPPRSGRAVVTLGTLCYSMITDKILTRNGIDKNLNYTYEVGRQLHSQ